MPHPSGLTYLSLGLQNLGLYHWLAKRGSIVGMLINRSTIMFGGSIPRSILGIAAHRVSFIGWSCWVWRIGRTEGPVKYL